MQQQSEHLENSYSSISAFVLLSSIDLFLDVLNLFLDDSSTLRNDRRIILSSEEGEA